MKALAHAYKAVMHFFQACMQDLRQHSEMIAAGHKFN